ncbi:MAG: carboxypeptidase regulatory-like domain-containing protein [Candidatus Dojkabacteria bacterium]
MERHSVPQNIMDVEFKLFGALTIRQFGYLAGGFIVALIIYFTGFPVILRVVLIIFSVLMGAFTSLVKINGQPSTVFIANFVLALFTSQQRVWRKKAVIPEILKEEKSMVKKKDIERIQKSEKAMRKSSVLPLEILSQRSDPTLDKVESSRLSQIEQHFDFAVEDLEKKTARVEEVKRDVKPPKSPPSVTAPPPQPRTIRIDPGQDNLAGDIASKTIEGEVVVKGEDYAAVVTDMGTAKVNRPLQTEKKAPEEPKQQTVQQTKVEVEAETTKKEQTEENVPGTRKPNLIVGIVMDKNNRPIPNVAISVKDLKEKLVRRVVSAQNGTFSLNTPLPSATYHIDLEADGFKFNRFQLILSGEPLPNYKFSAK